MPAATSRCAHLPRVNPVSETASETRAQRRAFITGPGQLLLRSKRSIVQQALLDLPLAAQEWEHRIDMGDVEAALADSDHVLEGDARIGGQVIV